MQAAVLGLCGDSARDVYKTRLLRTCSNNRRSGLAGGVLEARNFFSVSKVLRCRNKCVRVLEVQKLADFWEGPWLGVWSLGSARGLSLGTLVWSRVDRHVFVADSAGAQAWSNSSDSLGCPPWTVCNAGAPKKKRGFRGGDAAASGKKGLATRGGVSLRRCRTRGVGSRLPERSVRGPGWMRLRAASDGKTMMLSEGFPCARRPLFATAVCLTILTVADGWKKRPQRTRNHRLLVLLMRRRSRRFAMFCVSPH